MYKHNLVLTILKVCRVSRLQMCDIVGNEFLSTWIEKLMNLVYLTTKVNKYSRYLNILHKPVYSVA